jgi:RHS repeat-associated protein
MILDQTGDLANLKRHDYLPFGEELFAPAGGRTAAQGYTSGDGVRQQFTSKERDNETGLDYFLARYYSVNQGRFMSPDEFDGGAVEIFAAAASRNPTFYADLTEPQTLNKYQYCLNNPVRYIDPYGHQAQEGWYERLMKFLGLLWKSTGNSQAGLNYESSESRKPNSNGPLDLSAASLARTSWADVGKGLDVLAQTEMVLFDPFGVAGAADDVQRGNYANLRGVTRF